jgi:hypothetical protein
MTHPNRHAGWWLGLLVVLATTMPLAAVAQTSERLLLDPWTPGQRFSGDSSALIFDGGRLRADQSNVQIDEGETEARVRLMDTLDLNPSVGTNLGHDIWANISDTYDLNPSLGLDWQWMNVRDADHLVPEQLNNLSFAAGTPIAQSGPWFATTTFGLGYAGDGALADDRALYGKASLEIGRRLSSDTYLLMVLDYNGSRVTVPDLPLPAVEIRGRFSPTLKYMLGLPEASLRWEPDSNFSAQITYDLLETIEAQANYNLTRRWAVYAGYERVEQAFADNQLPADRRLFFIEQRAEAGVRFDPVDNVDIDLGGGYGFGQRFATGFDDQNLTNVTTITDRPYVRAAVTFSF